MPEWLYEAGIGEARAALVDGNRILQALIEPENTGPRLGTVSKARLVEITTKGREARITLADGSEATLSPLPPGITQGASLSVKIVREAIPEPGRPKRPKASPTDEPVAPGPDLLARITATGHPVRTLRPHEADALEQSLLGMTFLRTLTRYSVSGNSLELTD